MGLLGRGRFLVEEANGAGIAPVHVFRAERERNGWSCDT